MDQNGVLSRLKRDMQKSNAVTIIVPDRFSFMEHGAYDFDSFVSFFDWSHERKQVKIVVV